VRVIFQNPDDLATFVASRAIRPDQGVVIPGSGVDLHRFVPGPEPAGTPVVLFAARLLWPKGIQEIVEATSHLRAGGERLRLVVAGEPDRGNPECVPREQLEAWSRAGQIEWLGARTDMPELMRSASVVVLPSRYAEGVPKVLLEAAASGRPIVTTDAPGCRDAVVHGETGLLVGVGDVSALVMALKRLLCDPAERQRMGRNARELAERAFSETLVNERTLQVYRQLLHQS
jgi:glycosyltransferase involved in cell wall biosynthesis